jgi:excisionase family DNA binding protein
MAAGKDALISTTEAARLLGVTPRRVQALIAAGRLPCVRVGRTFVIRPEDVKSLVRLPVGWPKGRARSRE